MSGHEFKITVNTDYQPEDGDAFDAVVSALDFFEIPACISSHPDGTLRVSVDPDWEPPGLPESATEEPNTCFDAIVSALEHFYIPVLIVEAKPEDSPSTPASSRSPGGSMSGFALLEFLLVVSLASLAVLWAAEKQMRDLEVSRASLLGQELAVYNAGVQARLSAEPGLTLGPYAGTGWLKSVACGGTAPEDYVPCAFPDTTTFGRLTYSTTVATSGADLLATTVMPPLEISGDPRPDLSGYVALDALKRSTDGGVYYSYDSDPATAVITMTASTAPSTGPEYLRTDGANTMNADITFNNAFADRDINNARNVYSENLNATGNVQAGGAVRGALVASTGNVTAGGFVNATNSLRTAGYAQIGTNATVGGSATVGNAATGAGNLTVHGVAGARDLWIDDINQWASKGVYDVRVANSSDNADGSLGAPVAKITCPAGLNARAFWMPSGTIGTRIGGGATAKPLYGIWPAVHDWGTSWYLRTWILTSDGWSLIPTSRGRGVLIQKCV